jgi:hypothetical protein
VKLTDPRPNNERLLATGALQPNNASNYLLYEAELVSTDRMYSIKKEVLQAMNLQVRKHLGLCAFRSMCCICWELGQSLHSVTSTALIAEFAPAKQAEFVKMILMASGVIKHRGFLHFLRTSSNRCQSSYSSMHLMSSWLLACAGMECHKVVKTQVLYQSLLPLIAAHLNSLLHRLLASVFLQGSFQGSFASSGWLANPFLDTWLQLFVVPHPSIVSSM